LKTLFFLAWRKYELVSRRISQNAYKFDFPIHKPYFHQPKNKKELIWKGNQYFQGLNVFQRIEEKIIKNSKSGDAFPLSSKKN
jgi:excinuclease ABC subunit A